jgi:hypothetical protein
MRHVASPHTPEMRRVPRRPRVFFALSRTRWTDGGEIGSVAREAQARRDVGG